MDNSKAHTKFQKLWHQYAFIFERGNQNDLCNLFLIFNEYRIYLPSHIEDLIVMKLTQYSNPLLWANYLVYSKYYEPYHKVVLDILETKIDKEINSITGQDIMLHKEFWYIIVFHNCPYINAGLKQRMQNLINEMKANAGNTPAGKATNLICDYLLQLQLNQFFTWGYFNFSTSKQIAFRTYQRSLFKQYRKRTSSELYGSLD